MIKKNIKAVLVALSLGVLIAGCGKLSTEDLTKQVQQSMEEKLSTMGVKIDSLVLTKKSDNSYTGILETNEPNGKFTYGVDVTYDGKTFTWKLDQ